MQDVPVFEKVVAGFQESDSARAKCTLPCELRERDALAVREGRSGTGKLQESSLDENPPQVVLDHEEHRFETGLRDSFLKRSNCLEFFDLLLTQPFPEPVIDRLQLAVDFLDFQLGSGNSPRDLRVEIAPDRAADRHNHHAPIADCHNSAQLERGMESDQDGAGNPQEDVDLQPGFEFSPFAHEANSLAERVPKQRDHHETAADAKHPARIAARFQLNMQGRAISFGNRKAVVRIPMNGEIQHDGQQDAGANG